MTEAQINFFARKIANQLRGPSHIPMVTIQIFDDENAERLARIISEMISLAMDERK